MKNKKKVLLVVGAVILVTLAGCKAKLEIEPVLDAVTGRPSIAILDEAKEAELIDGKEDKSEKISEEINDERVSNIMGAYFEIKKVLGGNYVPDTKMPKEQLEDILGISPNEFQHIVAEVPMISVHVDTLIGIGAGKKVKDVEEALSQYRDSLINDSVQYPMNLAKVQASKVLTVDNDVYFIMLGAFDERDEITEEEALGFAKKEVDKVEKAIRSQYK